MLPTEAIDELTSRHRRARLAISVRLQRVIAQRWAELGGWDNVDIDRLAASVEPSAQLAKTATVVRATGFYSQVLEVRAPAIRPAEVATAIDYRQPFAATWHAFSMGRPFDEAIAAGSSAAEAAADRFLVSTSRLTGDLVARSTGRRTRWRRVPEPKACPWCITISGQLYLSAESADFGHDRCHCDPVPA